MSLCRKRALKIGAGTGIQGFVTHMGGVLGHGLHHTSNQVQVDSSLQESQKWVNPAQKPPPPLSRVNKNALDKDVLRNESSHTREGKGIQPTLTL